MSIAVAVVVVVIALSILVGIPLLVFSPPDPNSPFIMALGKAIASADYTKAAEIIISTPAKQKKKELENRLRYQKKCYDRAKPEEKNEKMANYQFIYAIYKIVFWNPPKHRYTELLTTVALESSRMDWIHEINKAAERLGYIKL